MLPDLYCTMAISKVQQKLVTFSVQFSFLNDENMLQQPIIRHRKSGLKTLR